MERFKTENFARLGKTCARCGEIAYSGIRDTETPGLFVHINRLICDRSLDEQNRELDKAWDEGYSEGHDEGYDEGYEDGVAANKDD
jgi:hypothetical protein